MTNFGGIWRLDTARSRLHGPAVARMAMKIEHREPHFVQTIKAVFASGNAFDSIFIGVTTGEAFENGPPERHWLSRAAWQGDELVIESRFTLGARHLLFRDHWYRCGTALVMEHRDDDLAGQITWLEPAPEEASLFAPAP